jgi:hypothetical protein
MRETRTLARSAAGGEREDTMNLGKAQSIGFIEDPVEEPAEEPVVEIVAETANREEQPALTQ